MNRGFTLIEVLVSFVIITTVAVIGVSSLIRFRDSRALDIEADKIISTLRQAQSKARNQEDNTRWGVYFHNSINDNYTLFQVDEGQVGILDMPSTGVSEVTTRLASEVIFLDPAESSFKTVLFSKGTGLPNNPATIIISRIDNEFTANLIVSEQGLIEKE